MWYAPCKDGMLWSVQTLVRSLVGQPWWPPLDWMDASVGSGLGDSCLGKCAC